MSFPEFGSLWGSWWACCPWAPGLCVPAWCMWAAARTPSSPSASTAQELKDLGVTVFIVSTGRGNLLELSAAASAPPEKYLHFVDVDDLHIIAQELRASILDAMRPQQLRASEVTSSGFRLAWPPLLTADSGYYMLELAPSTDPGTVRRQQLPGNATSWAWTNLDPDTDYEVALVPESNVHLVRPQHLRVHTLPGPRWVSLQPQRCRPHVPKGTGPCKPQGKRMHRVVCLGGELPCLGGDKQGPLGGGSPQRFSLQPLLTPPAVTATLLGPPDTS